MSAPAPAPAPNQAAGPLSKQRLRVWLKLLRASRTVEARLRERLKAEHGSTLPRFDVMAALARAPGGLRMSELSAMLRVSNGNVTGIVERLAAEGLVTRAPVAGDRRAMQVALTDAGAARFAEMAAAHEAWVDELLGALDAEDLEDALRLLSRVREEER